MSVDSNVKLKMTVLDNSNLVLFLLILTLTARLENKTGASTVSPNEASTTRISSAPHNSPASEKNKDEDYSTSTEYQSNFINKTIGIEGVLGSTERPSWFKDAIKDVTYYLRAHKFYEYDRRYNRNGSKVERTYFKYFPKPPLRALHWEVHKYCESSFLHCVDYLRKKLKHVALKRQDDTSVVVQVNNWGIRETEKISLVDVECRRMRTVDDEVSPPFEGPLERYQWRVTASYFMCWYTMNEVPYLKDLEEKCDNFAYCLDMSIGPNNKDTRANYSKPFACAQYRLNGTTKRRKPSLSIGFNHLHKISTGFCPDPCCANKHLKQMDFCWNNDENPCFHDNSAGQRECLLNRNENTDFSDLILNRWNITCKCPMPGYSWSSLYGICVDIDECTDTKLHGCTSQGQACVNLPGSFSCICKWGYIYSEKDKKCTRSDALSEMKLNSQQKNNNETTDKWKWLMRTVVNAIGRSCSSNVFNGYNNNPLLLLLPVYYVNIILYY